MAVIEGSGLGRPISSAGAPVAGTDEVQTLTIGGTPEVGSTFRITIEGFKTAPIPWNSTNATLIASIDSALEALPVIGTGGVTTAAGTVTAGIGTITLTFSGANTAKRDLGQGVVSDFKKADGSASAGTGAIATTTPGVAATGGGAPKGALLIDTTNGTLYQNTGTAAAPTWTSR